VDRAINELGGVGMETVKIYRFGNLICAIIGNMPAEKAVGFGSSAALAIQALSDELSKIGDEKLDLDPETI
jgi:mevalonate kinase